MTAFRYDEESVREAEPEWADQYQADQAIVLLSDFQTDKHGGDGSLNPNEIYQDWQWCWCAPETVTDIEDMRVLTRMSFFLFIGNYIL